MPNLLHQQSESVNITLRLPARMDAELKAIAERENISINSVIVRIIANDLRGSRKVVK